jgi:hypothetical protein
MKKKIEKFGKSMARTDMKKIAGGKRDECVLNGSPFDPTTQRCCSGCWLPYNLCVACNEIP